MEVVTELARGVLRWWRKESEMQIGGMGWVGVGCGGLREEVVGLRVEEEVWDELDVGVGVWRVVEELGKGWCVVLDEWCEGFW